MDTNNNSFEKMKLLLTIQDYTDESHFLNDYLAMHLPLHVSTHGFGTATSDILDYLGLGNNKKSIVLSTIAPKQVPQVFNYLKEKLSFDKPGRGVAITIPITSLSRALLHLDKEQFNSKSTSEVNTMDDTKQYELIIAILSQGYADDAMAAARANGANGGSLIHGNGLGSLEASKFLGITVQPEKDIVLIVVDKEKKNAVMNGINEAVGLQTPGKGVLFTLPVADTLGLQ